MAKAMTLKTIKANIVTIAATGATLDALIHSTACGIIAHAEKHGDCDAARLLCDAMPKSGRPKALRAWFETFSPIRFNGDGEVGLLADKDKRVWLTKEALATPLWELNPEKPVVAFDLDKALAAVLKRYDDQARKGIIKPDAKLQARMAAVKALTVKA